MCRLFGFRSIIQSQVHTSLVGADNALVHQSLYHPDGWGVAYYLEKAPHVIRSLTAAIDCQLFEKVSGLVSSQTVLAHLRKATIGKISVLDTHPFQYGPWTFAHNGNIKNFSCDLRRKFLEKIEPKLRRFVLGETDSELIFFMLLSFLARRSPLAHEQVAMDDLAWAAKKVRTVICELAGPLCADNQGASSENFLTFIVTNGQIMLAHQGGKSLYYSSYKTRCSERRSCPYFSAECEKKSTTGKVNHLILSSEPLLGENVWLPLNFQEMIGIDEHMQLSLYPAVDEKQIGAVVNA